MNFRLVYQGPLKASGQSDTRRQQKHDIRCVIGRQLAELFERKNPLDKDVERWEDMPLTLHDNFIFHALVREKLNLVCDLDILFLRRDEPGSLIDNGGDLDNRIKTLFDALRIPTKEEIRGYSPNPERVIPCLTEDDKLITGFRVTTDRWLEPPKSEGEQSHVHIIINVEVRATKLTQMNMDYFSHF